jgi:hypothetical protein
MTGRKEFNGQVRKCHPCCSSHDFVFCARGEFQRQSRDRRNRPQLETSIDIIAAALDQSGIPYKVVGESSRRAENDKMADEGALSLLYLNQEIVLHSRPKLVATCYDAKGTVLWQEETNVSFTMTQVGSAKTLAGRIAKKISDPGFGGACFPSR